MRVCILTMYRRIQNPEWADYASRLIVCPWCHVNVELCNCIAFISETTSTHNGVNYTQNNHLWTDENPDAAVDKLSTLVVDKCVLCCHCMLVCRTLSTVGVSQEIPM